MQAEHSSHPACSPSPTPGCPWHKLELSAHSPTWRTQAVRRDAFALAATAQTFLLVCACCSACCAMGAGSGPHPQQEREQPHGSPNNRGSQLEEGVEAAPAAPAIAVWAQRIVKCLGINPFACPGSGILVFANKY